MKVLGESAQGPIPQHACPLCRADSVAKWESSLNRSLRPADLRITDAGYGDTLALRRCTVCGFIFANGEDLSHLDELYGEMTDADYIRSRQSRRRQMQWILDHARRARPAARTLLDVGAGLGLMVRTARDAGLEAHGIEPSAHLVEQAKILHDVELTHGVFPHALLEGKRFDIVTLVDLIEHVADPVSVLRASAKALKPDGVCVAITPDASSVPARLLGRRWWHYRLAHVGYFDRTSIKIAAQRSGLCVAQVARAKWFLPIGYLAQRCTEYVPIGGLARVARRIAPLRKYSRRTIGLNLHDSLLVTMTRQA